jgi:hypothetical protein
MQVHIKKMNRVIETTDDRGGLGKTIGFYEMKSEAEAVAKGRGWYGGDARLISTRILQVVEIVDGSPVAKNYVLDNTFSDPVALEVDLVQDARDKLEAVQAKAKSTFTAEELAMLKLNLP